MPTLVYRHLVEALQQCTALAAASADEAALELLVGLPLVPLADLSTEAGGLEAGKLSVCAGRGCVGRVAVVLEAAVELAIVAEVEVVELLAICWNLPRSRLCSK